MLEPYQIAENIAAEGDKWLESRPLCVDCEEPITADKCFVFDIVYPRDACMCDQCYSKNISRLDEFLQEILDDAVQEYWQETPEGGEG